jgi:hypothetical protein
MDFEHVAGIGDIHDFNYNIHEYRKALNKSFWEVAKQQYWCIEHWDIIDKLAFWEATNEKYMNYVAFVNQRAGEKILKPNWFKKKVQRDGGYLKFLDELKNKKNTRQCMNTLNIEQEEVSEELRFSTNWNNKLNCQCFTTLRRSTRFEVGQLYRITLKGKVIGIGKVVAVSIFLANKLSEAMSYIDTGYSRAETLHILRQMYEGFDEQKHTMTHVTLLIVKRNQYILDKS